MSSTTRKPCIAVIGSLNYDLVSRVPYLPKAGETLTSKSFSTNCGGKGANQAVAAARFANLCEDVDVKMVGAVGDDEFGGHLTKGLKDQNISTDDIIIVDGMNTGVAVIVVEEDSGENRIMISPGANGHVNPESIPEYLFETPTKPDLIVLQLEIPLSSVDHIIQRASSAHIPVLLNPAPAIPLPNSIYPLLDTLILNETEASLLTGISPITTTQAPSAIAHLRSVCSVRGDIVITLGSSGSVLSSRDGGSSTVHVPADRVASVVDTTGAGDTFVGAIAVTKAQGPINLEEAVRKATAAAAWSVGHKGTWDSMPLGRQLQ